MCERGPEDKDAEVTTVWAHSKTPSDPGNSISTGAVGIPVKPDDSGVGIRGRRSHGNKEDRDDVPQEFGREGKKKQN